MKAIALAVAATSLASAIRLTAVVPDESNDWKDDLKKLTTIA